MVGVDFLLREVATQSTGVAGEDHHAVALMFANSLLESPVAFIQKLDTGVSTVVVGCGL